MTAVQMELNRDGGVRRIRFGDLAVNLFIGSGAEPGPANLWLRLHRGGRVDIAPLLGPGSLRQCGGLEAEVRLALADDEPLWCWQVDVENRSPQAATFDLVYAQDLALADYAAVRLNEAYVSHYLDLTPLSHPRCGRVVAARQNLKVRGRNPWAVVGSLRRGASFATDALQLHGLATRLGAPPEGLLRGLPGLRLQHEHAMAAVQDEPVTLAPDARWSGGFFVALQADHPEATSERDLPFVDGALSRAAALPARAVDRADERTLFSAAPFLDCSDLDEAGLRRLFGSGFRHEERDDSGLLSFFCGERDHVVLRAKEARTQRPHGHMLRTGRALVPQESSLTSTVWMAGVFHSMATQGHVSINRFLSTQRSWLGLFRARGLRLFVGIDGTWRLLGVPSAFEMSADSCRWIYRHASGSIEVVSAPDEALTLRARVLEGPDVSWLATLHVALGGDDGDGGTPIAWRAQGRDVFVPVPEGSELHRRFPGGGFLVSAAQASAVHGDARLFLDGQGRGLPFLCFESGPGRSFGLDISGRLIADARPASPPPTLPLIETRSREAGRIAEMLPWLLDDALVQYLAPRGLEQYSGGGWGTRDVCQGPLEMLLALDCAEPARDLLLRVFAAQNADGDWPQWFQFIERERDIRAGDSHGDIVFWPLLGLARYVLATGDTSLFDARARFHDESQPATLLQHVERALALADRRRVAGTALAAYWHGDWNDSLQPAQPSLREKMCSAWTVTLNYQTATMLAKALRLGALQARADALDADAGRIRDDFRRLLMADGVIAGYAIFPGDGNAPELLLHPRDRRTGVRYSLLPIMHAILEDLCTPEEAADHVKLMREHLWGPDGARLFDRPLTYRGGVERLFQRAETAAFFGREIGLMYTHAHLRFAQMQAHLGDASGLLRSLALAHPIELRQRLPQANLRQANCYFSSSDAAFPDRYEAQANYGRIASGQVALDGGWRVYSSGPGIMLSIVAAHLLGIRREGTALIVDPVIAPELDGLRAKLSLLGRRVQVEYRAGQSGHSPRRIVLNGRALSFTPTHNPYREGGAAIAVADWIAQQRADGPDFLLVELG